MSGDSGDIYQYKYLSRRLRVASEPSKRRIERNAEEANVLENQGYDVMRNIHPNGAYLAVIGKHPAHEVEVGRIFAENGFAFTLDKEGNAKIKIKGQSFTLPSPDGRVEGFTHEIYALTGEPSARTVAYAINHSYKPFKQDSTKSVQSNIAITIAPKGSRYKKKDISDGVKEYKRQVMNGETKAKPLLYLHVNEATRAIYRWNIK